MARTLVFIFLILSIFFAPLSLYADEPNLWYRVEEVLLPSTNATTSLEQYIVADLDGMKVMLMAGGVATKTFPILSKGRKGTPWETPAGVYHVLTKEDKHFSSLGHVWMPWSMQFFGNFFIHGWPYDVEGNDVPRGYSGGCIRLSTADALEVFNFAKRGTPILVSAHTTDHAQGGYYVTHAASIPNISAQALIVADPERAQILWRKSETQLFPDATSGKFLAALTALEAMNQYKERELPSEGTPSFASWMKGYTQLPVREMIAPLLYASTTEAEELLARSYGKKGFIRLMNQKATAFGMESTLVVDAGGALSTNVSSAKDLVALARALKSSKPYLLQLSATSSSPRRHADGQKALTLINNNKLVSLGINVDGGYIDDIHGNGLVLLQLPLETTTSRPVIIALMGSKDIATDISSIETFLQGNMKYIPYTDARVVYGKKMSFLTKLRTMKQAKKIANELLGKSPVHNSLSIESVGKNK